MTTQDSAIAITEEDASMKSVIVVSNEDVDVEVDWTTLHIEAHKPWYRDCDFIKLVIMLVMVIMYFFAELIVGIMGNSLALVADAFHMLSDAIGLVIGLVGVIVSNLVFIKLLDGKKKVFQSILVWLCKSRSCRGSH